MSSNKKLLQAWKNLDVVLKKDVDTEDDFGYNLDQNNFTKTAQSFKTSKIPSRPQSSYVVRARPISAYQTTKGFTRSPTTTQASFYLSTKGSPTNMDKSPQGLIQMFSPKAKYFDDNTVLHSVSVQDLRIIYEKKCVDNKNDHNGNQLNYFIDRFDKNCKKKVFNLEDQYIGPNASIEIANLLANNSHFIHVNLSRNSIGDIGAKHMAAALLQNDTIIHLDLSNNGIGHEGAADVFEMLAHNETLISLRLNSQEGLNRNRIDMRGMKPLATSLKENQTLQFLDVSGSSITLEGATSLAEGLVQNRNLASLNIADNELGARLQPLVRAIATSNLIELNISSNKIGDAGLQVLLGIFQQGGSYSTKLQILDISKNNITCFGATKLFDVMLKNMTIRKLILDHNNLAGRGISNIVNMLWENPIINYLSLYDCELNYEGADALGIGLARNLHIETLIVGKNPFRDEGIKLLVPNLKDNRIVTHLDLSGCKIREEGGKLLADMITANHNLIHLDLKDNYLNDEAGICLSNAVKINKRIMKLNLDRNMTSYKYIIDIQKSLKANAQEIKKQSASTFVQEMTYLKEFESQKHVVAQEGRIFNAKQAEVNEDLQFHTDMMNDNKKDAQEKLEQLEDEYAWILEEQRKLDRERLQLEDDVQQAKADGDTEMHFTKFNIDNALQEIEEFSRGIKRVKESTDQSKITYERQIMKLKTEIGDRERVVNVLESTVTATENQVNRLRDEKAGGPRSPGKDTKRSKNPGSPKKGDETSKAKGVKGATKSVNKGFGAMVNDLEGEKTPPVDLENEMGMGKSSSAIKLKPIGEEDVKKGGKAGKSSSKTNIKSKGGKDARSYSPLSFLANPQMNKTIRPENIKNKFLPPDVMTTWSVKPPNPLAQQKNNVSCNYKRSRKKKNSTNLNNTISHDESQNTSFCDETPANMSYIDMRSNKNISHNQDLFQASMKEKGNKSREIKHENIGFNVDKRYYSNFRTTLLQQGTQQHQMLDRIFSNKRGRSSAKKEESSFNLGTISREKNNFPAFPPNKKQQERIKICPKITPVKSKNKEELRNEKLMLIEKTYSLSPHKTKNSKSPKINEIANLDKSVVHTTSKKNKLNKTDDKFYQMKSPLEATRQRTTSKDAKEKGLQPLPRYRTPKISNQNQSPTDYRYSKETSSIFLRKDESLAKTSNRTNNTSQVKVNSENTSRNNKDLISVSSIVQCHSRTPMEKNEFNTSMISRDDEYSSRMFHSISKQISQSSNRDFNSVNHTGVSEKAYAKTNPVKRGRKFNKTEVNFNQRCYTVSNNSISNIFESAEMNSHRHMSIGGRLSTMENEADKSYEIYQADSGAYTPNKLHLKPPKDEFTPMQRQESFENVLDDFADKSMQVSVQDHNQSFALSSTGKAQFDDLLGASLISYLNDKGTAHDPSKKELETTLSISKHPVFKRSRVFVSKGITSTDKDGLLMISTNANSKATYKNDSVQLESVKEEYFQSEAGIEKNSVLEIDFNFGEDMKLFKGNNNNVIGNQVSPSFPAQVPSQTKFSQKPVLDDQEIDILNKKTVVKKKRIVVT